MRRLWIANPFANGLKDNQYWFVLSKFMTRQALHHLILLLDYCHHRCLAYFWQDCPLLLGPLLWAGNRFRPLHLLTQ